VFWKLYMNIECNLERNDWLEIKQLSTFRFFIVSHWLLCLLGYDIHIYPSTLQTYLG